MSGFAKLTGKALRALAEEYEVQLPAGRITKGKLIEILEAENIQPPWGRSGMEMPDSGQLHEGGTPSRDRPPADLAGSSSSLAGFTRGQAAMARSASIVGISRKKKLLHYRGARITPAGREILAELQGVEKDA